MRAAKSFTNNIEGKQLAAARFFLAFGLATVEGGGRFLPRRARVLSALRYALVGKA